MAINVADNFSYKGSKPLDARIKYATISDMASVSASDLYDGCLAYVVAEKKNYQYDSSNTSDPTTGKWRELETGGSGASTFSDLTDVNLTSVQNGQVAKYNSTSEKWENGDINKSMNYDDFDDLSQAEKDNGTAYYVPDASIVTNFTVMGNRFDKANIYTNSERMIGSYLGKPLYQKTINVGTLPSVASTEKSVATGVSNIDKVISCHGYAYSSSAVLFIQSVWGADPESNIGAYYSNGNIKIVTGADRSAYTGYVTIQYTKTTDATVNIGTGNDYSTDEQIIGTWIDGKPLYQKTLLVGQLPNNTTKAVPHGVANLKRIIYFEGYGFHPSGVCVPLQRATNTASDAVSMWQDGANINVLTSIDYSSYTESYITIRYTKTTD